MRHFYAKWVITGFVIFGMVVSVQAAIPQTISFQGRLTDSAGKQLDGSFSVIFRIYSAVSGGTKLWEETQTVLVSKGLFSTPLGTVTPLTLAFDQPYWVELQVGAETLTPRQPLSSSPYTFRAQQLDGVSVVSGNVGIGTTAPGYKLDVADRIRLRQGPNGDAGLFLYESNVDQAFFGMAGDNRVGFFGKTGGFNNWGLIMNTSNGNVGIGTTAPASKLHISGTVLLENGNQLLQKDSGGTPRNLLTHWSDDNVYLDNPNNQIILRTGSGLGNVVAINSSGNVGIGTTAPGYKLDVTNRIRLREGPNGSSAGLWLYQLSSSSDQAFIGMAGDNRVGFYGNTGLNNWGLVMDTSNGNVGIGTTAPTQKLEVNGAVRLTPSGAPASQPGSIYFDSAKKHFYGYNGTTWKKLDN